MKVMSPFFLSNCIYICNEIYTCHVYILYKVEVVFPQILFITNTLFPP
jgi:hypothetical protein